MPEQDDSRRQFSYEYKLEVVEKHMLHGIPIKVLATEYELHPRLIIKWRTRYVEYGRDGLLPKTKGRPKGTTGIGKPKKKFNSELERLQYENMKLKMENLRLKKVQEYLRGNARSVSKK